jgi:hypothetical protein
VEEPTVRHQAHLYGRRAPTARGSIRPRHDTGEGVLSARPTSPAFVVCGASPRCREAPGHPAVAVSLCGVDSVERAGIGANESLSAVAVRRAGLVVTRHAHGFVAQELRGTVRVRHARGDLTLVPTNPHARAFHDARRSIAVVPLGTRRLAHRSLSAGQPRGEQQQQRQQTRHIQRLADDLRPGRGIFGVISSVAAINRRDRWGEARWR